ncbi:MAG: hypothetical protein ND895_13045 [Pyrinomonadaceae bacterium]|nr:hypothetical protein [Pyrinomonadaceae bacterium]
MQETELDENLDPKNYPPWWKRLLIGALIGGFVGALEIWFYEFSLVRLLSAVLAGATYFAMLGLFAPKFGKDRLKLIALSGLAAIVAAAVYWVVARPSSPLLLALGIGLVGGIVYAWAEA